MLVGFGDYVPGKTFRGDMTPTQFLKMTCSTLYCLLGLALIAMGIDLASEQVSLNVKMITAHISGCIIPLFYMVWDEYQIPDTGFPAEYAAARFFLTLPWKSL